MEHDESGQYYSGIYRRGERERTYQTAGAVSDGILVLSPAGDIYDLAADERLVPPPGQRYHPAVRRLNQGRRLLFNQGLGLGSPVIDLDTEKIIAPAGDYRNVSFGEVAGTAVGILVPAPKIDVTPRLLELWVQVTVRGQLGADGRFSPSDESTWEGKQQELAAHGRPVGTFPFPGEVARDRLYWLRKQIDESSAGREELPLLERLVTAEPTSRQYLRLAKARFRSGQVEPAIRDLITAERLADPVIWKAGASELVWLEDLAWEVVRRPDSTIEAYRYVYDKASLIRFEVWRSGVKEPSGNFWRAWAAYRLGLYAEAVAQASQEDVQRVQECAAALVG